MYGYIVAKLCVWLFTGNEECLKVLVAKGGDVNIQDEEGDTALHVTGRKGNEPVYSWLVVHITSYQII